MDKDDVRSQFEWIEAIARLRAAFVVNVLLRVPQLKTMIISIFRDLSEQEIVFDFRTRTRGLGRSGFIARLSRHWNQVPRFSKSIDYNDLYSV
jgi:hypothetical protein